MRSALVSLGCYKKTPAYAGQLVLAVLEAGKSKFKRPTDLVPGENPLPGLQSAAFCLCAYLGGGVWREHAGALVFLPNLIRTLIPSCSSTLMTSSKPYYLQSYYFQILSHWGLEL